MELLKPLEVTYESTDDLATASRWLAALDSTYDILALDFETAPKYSPTEVLDAKTQLGSEDLEFFERIRLQNLVSATGLSHPSCVYPTHISIAWSETEAKVIIIHTHELLDLVMTWLTTTTVTQVWHNASFDLKHVHYHTSKFPKNYEDTQILAKTILNHVDNFKSKTGLKELAGDHYGAWGISADNFTVAQMHEPFVLKYAATDACATMWLWNSIANYLKEQDDK